MFYLNYWGSQPPFLIKKLYLLQIFPPNLMFFFYCSLLLLLLFWLTGTFWIYMWFGGNFIFKKLEVELKTLSSCALEAQTWDLGLKSDISVQDWNFKASNLRKEMYRESVSLASWCWGVWLSGRAVLSQQ